MWRARGLSGSPLLAAMALALLVLPRVFAHLGAYHVSMRSSADARYSGTQVDASACAHIKNANETVIMVLNTLADAK